MHPANLQNPNKDQKPVQQPNKPSLKQSRHLLAQSRYPRGDRQTIINQMTKISESDQQAFNKCRNWNQVVMFHKKHTPWLEDTQINEYVKLYKMQAQTKKHKGQLKQSQEWMLNDL